MADTNPSKKRVEAETKGPIGDEAPAALAEDPWRAEIGRVVGNIGDLLPVLSRQQDDLRARIERMELVAMGLVEAMRSMEALLRRVSAMRDI